MEKRNENFAVQQVQSHEVTGKCLAALRTCTRANAPAFIMQLINHNKQVIDTNFILLF